MCHRGLRGANGQSLSRVTWQKGGMRLGRRGRVHTWVARRAHGLRSHVKKSKIRSKYFRFPMKRVNKM
eukprot:5505785-Prymnesium_polylepis.3